MTTFFPLCFPEKTPPGLLSFCIWSWIQDLSMQLWAILATQRVLEGGGVGKDGTTANCLICFNQFYGLRWFQYGKHSLVCTALALNRFRSNVKKWCFFADIINDVGITMEVGAMLVPQNLFLAHICKYVMWLFFEVNSLFSFFLSLSLSLSVHATPS